MKRAMAWILALVLLVLCAVPTFAVEEEEEELSAVSAALTVKARSAVLMDVQTGTVLFAQNADESLPPASVTKVMTLLLVAEAVDSGRIALTDMVTVSQRAASMGGSQIYLEVGEEMSVEDMIKSVVVASANDAACALAEHLCGSEEAFVVRMNARAQELGMKNTHFENTNGLDDTTENHLTSARDIAIMSRELLHHTFIMNYTTIWMDTVRQGAFTLTNTNRLVRFYSGCTGLKTGSTAKAKFCISASAERNGLHLVAVIMGAESRDIRNEEAKKLLDFGFANYALYTDPKIELPVLPVRGGVSDTCSLTYEPLSAVMDKTKAGKVQVSLSLSAELAAPVRAGDEVGSVIYTVDGQTIASRPVKAADSVEKIAFADLFARLLRIFTGGI